MDTRHGVLLKKVLKRNLRARARTCSTVCCREPAGPSMPLAGRTPRALQESPHASGRLHAGISMYMPTVVMDTKHAM